ncbi:hypothetical protein PCANC_02191 [Puccinia coronata f. sp. avenae]|uniref:Uncharacterized protein n=1 Tax=Puccinia coronata f. sp. avenae TaxID=200324 RepID=A0A2N5W0X7_9BASI|nr:hypothetical protein PCANC_02191 [Puccinia coronata f. sp. avenae]
MCTPTIGVQACRACTPVRRACKACTPFGKACRLCTPVGSRKPLKSRGLREPRYPYKGTEVPRVLRTLIAGLTTLIRVPKYPYKGTEVPLQGYRSTLIRVPKYPYKGTEVPLQGYRSTLIRVPKYPYKGYRNTLIRVLCTLIAGLTGLREPTGVQGLHACPKGVQALHALQTGVQALHACTPACHVHAYCMQMGVHTPFGRAAIKPPPFRGREGWSSMFGSLSGHHCPLNAL